MTNAVGLDERLRRPARLRSLRLGETTVSYVPDGVVPLHPRRWLPASTEQAWAAHPEYLDASGNLVASIGGLLVERGTRGLLIDAGFGPGTLPAEPGDARGTITGGALLDSLAAVGRDPASIEAVAFTHLHLDHVGWAWQPGPGAAAPPFVGAEYLVAEPEWTRRELLEAHGTGREILDALAPRVRTVSEGEEIFPDVRVRLTDGHTPGHTSYVITGGGRRLIVLGDALHTPLQVAYPEWSAVVDHDRALSAEHRRRLVAALAEPGTVGFGGHFADVVFGRVRLVGDDVHWQPVPTDEDRGPEPDGQR
jgi:glyoxylase-like metal-dependent hydrolase (beta-lactamase superfamily II)